MSAQKLDRGLALACDRALVGLDPRREAELVASLPPGQGPDPRLELAVAAVVLSEMAIDEPLPEHIAARVLAGFSTAPASRQPITGGGTVLIPTQQKTELVAPPSVGPRSGPASYPQASQPSNVVPIAPRRRSAWIPWLAAAACFALAAASIYGSRLPRPQLAVRAAPGGVFDGVKAPAPAAEPTLAEKRARLVADAKDVVKVAWSPTKDAAGQGETGEVVWSNERQEGYMTFRAVQKNDPSKSQYQLWIFDGERDERYPVDGGVFDVDASTGEVIVPITAKVPVVKPTWFAVTDEAPGGVVVSKRERIVVAAKVAG